MVRFLLIAICIVAEVGAAKTGKSPQDYARDSKSPLQEKAAAIEGIRQASGLNEVKFKPYEDALRRSPDLFAASWDFVINAQLYGIGSDMINPSSHLVDPTYGPGIIRAGLDRLVEAMSQGRAGLQKALARLKVDTLVDHAIIGEFGSLPQEAKKLGSAEDILTVSALGQITNEVNVSDPKVWNEVDRIGTNNYVDRVVKKVTTDSGGAPQADKDKSQKKVKSDECVVTSGNHPTEGPWARVHCPRKPKEGGKSGEGEVSVPVPSPTQPPAPAKAEPAKKDEDKGGKPENAGQENRDQDKAKSPPPDSNSQSESKDDKKKDDGTPNPMNDPAPIHSTIWASVSGANGKMILPIRMRGATDPSPLSDYSGPSRTLWSVFRSKIFWELKVRGGVFDPSPISDSGFVAPISVRQAEIKPGAGVDRPILAPTTQIDPTKLIKPYARTVRPTQATPVSQSVAQAMSSVPDLAKLPAGTKIQVRLDKGKLGEFKSVGATPLSVEQQKSLAAAMGKWKAPAGATGVFEFVFDK